VLSDLVGFAFVTRGKEYTILDHPSVAARLHLPPDQSQQRTAKPDRPQSLRLPRDPSGTRRGDVPCSGGHAIGPRKRRVPLASPARGSSTNFSSPICPRRHSPPSMSSSCTCIAGPYAPTLADEDTEQDPDRWCSHSAWGQECWQLVSQWVWNLRLELGHQLEPMSPRITEFAPALSSPREQEATRPALAAPASGYGPPTTATRLGKLAASPAKTSLSSPMERSGVQQEAP
jgi:hypothetical protein